MTDEAKNTDGIAFAPDHADVQSGDILIPDDGMTPPKFDRRCFGEIDLQACEAKLEDALTQGPSGTPAAKGSNQQQSR
jgi:hypothetical protein